MPDLPDFSLDLAYQPHLIAQNRVAVVVTVSHPDKVWTPVPGRNIRGIGYEWNPIPATTIATLDPDDRTALDGGYDASAANLFVFDGNVWWSAGGAPFSSAELQDEYPDAVVVADPRWRPVDGIAAMLAERAERAERQLAVTEQMLDAANAEAAEARRQKNESWREAHVAERIREYRQARDVAQAETALRDAAVRELALQLEDRATRWTLDDIDEVATKIIMGWDVAHQHGATMLLAQLRRALDPGSTT